MSKVNGGVLVVTKVSVVPHLDAYCITRTDVGANGRPGLIGIFTTG